MDRFPSELLIDMLKLLPFFMILRAREVCRHWHQVIQFSVALQYYIELGVHKKVDGPSSKLSVADRLQVLRKHAAAWRDLSWSRRDLFRLDEILPRFLPYFSYDQMDNLLSGWEKGDHRRVSLHGFPSTLEDNLARTQIPDGITLYLHGIIMDAEQDVVILEPNNEPSRTDVMFHALSTIADHPSEPSVLLKHPSQLRILNIMGDLLLLRHLHRLDVPQGLKVVTLIIFQRTTRRIVSQLANIPEYASFTFISDRHFAMADSQLPGIGVYEIRISQRLDEVTTPVHLASYLLPHLKPQIRHRITVAPHAPPTSNALRQSQKPFTDSTEDWLVGFMYWGSRLGYRELPLVQIVTHTSTLLQCTSHPSGAPPVRVPWAQWGLEKAHCFLGFWDNRSLSTHGERCVVAQTGTSRGKRVHVYDFNQARVRRAQQATTSPVWPPYQDQIGRAIHSLKDSASDGDTMKHGGFIEGEITGRLPYLMTAIDVEVESRSRVDIDEEHLMFMVSDHSDEDLEDLEGPNKYHLHVFTM